MNPLLRQLARLYDLQTSYIDVEGIRRVAGDNDLRAVLEARGVAMQRDALLRKAIELREEETRQQLVAPVHVVWNGKTARIPLQGSRSELSKASVHLTLDSETEMNESPRVRLSSGGKSVVAGPLPFGYHRLEVSTKGRNEVSWIFSAPGKAYQSLNRQREWGVFAPVYALHSRSSWGIGDFRDAENLIRWTGSLGATRFATLPLLASFLDQPFDPSPYAPVSRLFWNEIYLDVESLPELKESVEARELMNSPDFRRELGSLMETGVRGSAAGETSTLGSGRFQEGRLIDYQRVMRLKRSVLELLSEKFWQSPGPQFQDFLKSYPKAEDYASFRAAVERLGPSWHGWPAAAKEGRLTGRDFDARVRRYHLYVQYALDRQLSGLSRLTLNDNGSRGLYLDFPLGVHGDGYDVWRYQRLFARGASAGCPPDISFRQGQNWGFTPLDPDRIRLDGYRLMIDSVRNHLRYAGMLRVDHVMGLHRLWWVGAGQTPANGVYVRYRAEELYALFNIESRRARAMIVGEDLGTVPRYVRNSMDRRGFRRLFVLQRQFTHEKNPPGRVNAPMVASMNNHDMFPFGGFWEGKDIDEKREVGIIRDSAVSGEIEKRNKVRKMFLQFLRRSRRLQTNKISPGALIEASMDFLASSLAGTVLVNLEDLWSETVAQNIPTTTFQRPNWRIRLRYDLDSILKMGTIRSALERIERLRKGKKGSR